MRLAFELTTSTAWCVNKPMVLEEAQPRHGTREPTAVVGRQSLPVGNFGAGKYEHPSVPKSSGKSR
eukprot:7151751-Pyramimonas_sp.AAC.1